MRPVASVALRDWCRLALRSIATPALLAALGGCINLAPEYRRPDAPVATAFPAPPAPQVAATRAAADIGWREFFSDPRLQQLIDLALANNRSLREAVLRIEQAQGLYRVQRSEQLPNVNATLSANRGKTLAPIGPAGTTVTSTQYQVGLGITAFELDLFGRVRNSTQSALAQYFATIEAQRATQLSLVSQVARAYLSERALDEQLVLAQNTLKARRAGLEITQQRFQAGADSALVMRQAQSLVEQAAVSEAHLRRQHAQAINLLTLLVGTPLNAITLPPPVLLAEQRLPTALTPGLPAETLIARPDVRSAEQQLIAANADIGAARAAFFPRIALTTSLGAVSRDLDDLLGNGTGVWSFAPQLVQPVFTAGRNRGNLQATRAAREIALAQYERSIQSAFREVADALVARDALADELAAQERLVEAERARTQLTEQLYRAGASGFLDFLDAQRQLFAAEQALLQTRLTQATAAVDLYIALGGGSRQDTAGE